MRLELGWPGWHLMQDSRWMDGLQNQPTLSPRLVLSKANRIDRGCLQMLEPREYFLVPLFLLELFWHMQLRDPRLSWHGILRAQETGFAKR